MEIILRRVGPHGASRILHAALAAALGCFPIVGCAPADDAVRPSVEFMPGTGEPWTAPPDEEAGEPSEPASSMASGPNSSPAASPSSENADGTLPTAGTGGTTAPGPDRLGMNDLPAGPTSMGPTAPDDPAEPPGPAGMDPPPVSTPADDGSSTGEPAEGEPMEPMGPAEPPGGPAPVEPPSMEPPEPPPPKPTKLVVEVTTQRIGGMWGPLNAGAIWIEDSRGQWVHTLEYWTGILNVRHLTEYVDPVRAGAPSPGLFTFPAPPDTIGRATLEEHESHTLMWGLTDADGNEIPDGMYKLIIQCTEEENDPGETLEIDWEKGPAPMAWSPPDTPFFVGMKVSLE